jgi:hypothetical protein
MSRDAGIMETPRGSYALSIETHPEGVLFRAIGPLPTWEEGGGARGEAACVVAKDEVSAREALRRRLAGPRQ